MLTSLVFTFIADDKPGLVESISNAVAAHQGNWLESELSQLAGKFAGIVRISVDESHCAPLCQALTALEKQGMSVIIETSSTSSEHRPAQQFNVHIVGLDRPGIVKEVSQALALRALNVVSMSSEISSAPMTGEPLFNADVTVESSQIIELDELADQLDTIADHLTVEITIEEIEV